MNKEEELEITIKRFFDEKIIFIENEKVIVDFIKISEEDINFEHEFITDAKLIDNLIKKEKEFRSLVDIKTIYVNITVNNEISNIRQKHLNELISVSGMITNITSIHTLTINTRWECPSCGTIISKGGAIPPKRCSCSRRDGFKKIESELEDIQEMSLEEDYNNIGKKTPKKIRIRLLDELCDKDMNSIIIPGTKVEVIGIVELVPMPTKNNKTKEEISEFRVHALQINSLENRFDETITEEDIVEIEEISKDNPLKILSNFIAPNVKGKDLEKEGLLLSMVRGKPTFKADGREDKDTIHILLVGDAGQAKSDLLTACARLHYKGNYADCIGLSEPGLLATVEQDKLTGSWGLKPGLLVKQNKGLQVLDEFDKAKDDAKTALHTSLESKIITINKASIHTTLNADCTVLLGANPKNSRFDINRPLVEQINLVPTLLSRMDLIFLFIDNIEEEKDDMIADSVLGIVKDDEVNIDISFFKKYIKYIQKFEPLLDESCAKFLKDRYKMIRQMSKKSNGMTGMPIGPRHLKAMKRLAEAHAKIRMSNKIEKEDVDIAYKLFELSLLKLGLEKDGLLDFARIGPGITLKKKEKKQNILNVIKSKDEEKGFIVMDEIYEYAKGMQIDSMEVEKLVEELKDEGLIYSPKNGEYRYLG